MRCRFGKPRQSLSVAVALILAVGPRVLVPSAEAAPLGSSTAPTGTVPPPAMSATHSFQPDLFTGRATASIPIAVPPGRRGVQPNLALTYSSSARNGWLGIGWSLDPGFIERSTSTGVPRYDASDTFSLAFQGIGSDLVKIPDGTYRLKDDGSSLRIDFKGVAGWEVRDPSGTRYLFGQTAASQVATTGDVFRWCLDKVVDPNGNSMSLTYTPDQGQLYLAQIRYTAHDPTATPAANQVDFTIEPRPDEETSYRGGFAITTAKRVRSITAQATVNGTLSLARRYDLAYTPSDRTGRSLLSSIRQVGTDGASALPPVSFTYQSAAAPSYAVSRNETGPSSAGWNVQVAAADLGHDNHGVVHPYAGLPWGAPQALASPTTSTIDCVTATAKNDGSFTVSGCQDHYVHAWTWLYVSASTTMPISYAPGACDSNGSLWQEDTGGIRQIFPGSVTLAAGWTLLHLTDYHQHACFASELRSPLASLVASMSTSQFVQPQLAGDVDGDGMTDLVTFNAAAGTWAASRSRGAAFSPPAAWLAGFGEGASIPILGDWDADGRTDVAVYKNGLWRFARSTGSAFQTGVLPDVPFGAGTPLTGDFNGDGLVDLGSYSAGSWSVAVATGAGFRQAGTFATTFGSSDHEPLTGDFNGDGLTDLATVHKPSGDIDVRLSTGTAFAAPAKWLAAFGAGQPHSGADVNGDGFTDALVYDKATGQVRCALSTGSRFGSPSSLPVSFALRSPDDSLQLGDFNGDGLADPAVFSAVSPIAELGRSQGTFTDLLAGIANGLGGSTTIQYQPSTQCDNVCPIEQVPVLPFIVPLANRVSLSDGLGHTWATAYAYSKGRYDAPRREFRGFGRVEVRDPEGTVSLTEFSQDAQTKGRPLRTEIRDAFNNLWTKTDQAWSSTEPYAGVRAVRLDRREVVVCDGNPTCKQTASRMSYDAFGNVTRLDEEGEVGITGDERATVTTYAANPSAWIVNTPRLVQRLDAQGAVVSQRRLVYDAATDPTAPPSAGNVTKEEAWLNLPAEQWLATTLSYDRFGNVATVTDALGRTTTNTYDATGTYLTRTTDALGHRRELLYDPRFGQPTTSVDQNEVTTKTELDLFGRVAKIIGPLDTAALPTVRYDYDPCLTAPPCSAPIRTSVYSRMASGQAAELAAHTFSDGLGRAIQTRAPADASNQQVVTGAVELDRRGLPATQWAAYFEAASSVFVPQTPLTQPSPPTQYAYDPLGRAVRTIEPDGSVATTVYDDWTVTATDANAHQTRQRFDAFGRLIEITESVDAQPRTTRYGYDSLDHLVAVTDAAGNRIAMTHDSLGRKLSMDDPDMGRWTYQYDALDNLLSQTDARGVTTSFSYDSLNRLTSKAYAAPASVPTVPLPAPVAYAYDDPASPYTGGRLTSVTDGSGSSSFQYDALGRLVSESKTIDATTYTIQRAYDLLGRLITLTYPDGEKAVYGYNPQGIETISVQSAGGEDRLVTGVDYAAGGQITRLVYGNGTRTDYTYDPSTRRLERLVSVGPTGTLQDFSYRFDRVGNVLSIADAVYTATQSFEYDALNRLTGARGSYGNLAYRYDGLGNLLDNGGVALAYGMQDGSKPHAATAMTVPGAGSVSLLYDGNGNLIDKPSPVSGLLPQRFTFDAENRLVDALSPQQETVTLRFQPGWNFFSLPVIPDDRRVASLFPSFGNDIEQIAAFAPATESFTHHLSNPAFDDFTALEYGVGYQLYCKNPNGLTVTLTGQVPSAPLMRTLASGWHLLPAIALVSGPMNQVFGAVDYAQAQRYDASSRSLVGVSATAPGEAYYVQLRSSASWTPPLPRDVRTRFVYDGDGGRVKQITASGTTIFLGDAYEIAPDGQRIKSVFAGSQRVATIQ